MDLVRDFDSDVEWILDNCEKRVSTYPPSLRQAGRAYLDKYQLSKETSQRKGLIYLLPFWLKETLGVDQEACRLSALGITFGTLYFFVQDAVMDTRPGEYKGHLLPLGSLFFLDFIAPYRSLFDSGSPFWEYFEKYIEEWAESVLWERKHHWGQMQEYKEDDFIRLGHKASPLKVPCTAMSLLAGREDAIELLEEMLDYNLVVVQLMDDLRDWRGDLVRGNYTYFLTRVMAAQGISSLASLTEAEVEKALFIGRVFEEVLDLAADYNQRTLESISTLHAPYLEAYIDVLAQQCRQLKGELQAERTRRIREQFAFLLQGATAIEE